MADPRVLFACPSCGARSTVALITTGSSVPVADTTADRHVKLAAVAERLGCSPKKVRDLLELHGKPAVLPHIRVGIDYHVPERALEEWIAANTVLPR